MEKCFMRPSSYEAGALRKLGASIGRALAVRPPRAAFARARRAA
jgi:hypothetical protein